MDEFALPDPEAGPPAPESRVAARDHQAHSPVDVVLDAVVVEDGHVGRVAVLKEDVPSRPRAPVDTGAVDRQIVEEQDVPGRGRARRPTLERVVERVRRAFGLQRAELVRARDDAQAAVLLVGSSRWTLAASTVCRSCGKYG